MIDFSMISREISGLFIFTIDQGILMHCLVCGMSIPLGKIIVIIESKGVWNGMFIVVF